jgi:subtilisin family serine protease
LALPAAAATQPATWNFTQAQVPPAQPLGDYGRGVLVAVVDTWVDFTQPQFNGRVVDEADCESGTCVDKQYAPDQCVHGTHVAGTIASDLYGVAPEADILSVQVLSGPAGSTDNPNATCSGNEDSVAAGIKFAVDKGARVINLSLEDQFPLLLQNSNITQAVAYAAQHNVVVVFAAGNSNVPLTDDYGNNAIIVAATGPSGQLASYSNYNSAATGNVNVAAPGGDVGAAPSCSTSDCILSTFPHDEIGLLEGTSMAAPHVSGLAALLFAQDPSRSAADVVQTIEKTATPLPGAGSGLIDARAALEVEAASHPPQAGPPPASPGPGTGQGAGAPAATPITSAPIRSGGGGAGPVPVPVQSQVGPTATKPAGTGRTASSMPSTTPTVRLVPTGSPSAPPAVAADGIKTGAGGNSSGGSWPNRHAALLVGAGVLLVGDVLALAWTREVRRVFGSAA